jgi:hypothetical protein
MVDRTLESLKNPSAPSGCDPADDHLLDTDADAHIEKYSEIMTSERIAFKLG